MQRSRLSCSECYERHIEQFTASPDHHGCMKHRVRAVLFVLGAALLLMPWSDARAELVRAQLEGTVASSPIVALNGQRWVLVLVFDTAAPESPFSAGSPNFAAYFNTGPVKVLRNFDFSVGESSNFTIQLVDPVPSNESDVRIDVDNFGSKTFFTHVDDVALLPTWNGLQLDNFLLGLEDLIPGGYADGTDRLPGASLGIGIDEFTGFKQVRLQIGQTGQLIGTPTSFTLAPVPELSPGVLCIVGGIAVLLLKRVRRERKFS
jgi:hypothetical protein